MVYRQSTATLGIAGATLKIHAGLYNQKVLRSDLRIDEARILDLKSNHLHPQKCLNGTGALDLKAGWLELKNGEKVFLLVADPNNVLYLPSDKFPDL